MKKIFSVILMSSILLTSLTGIASAESPQNSIYDEYKSIVDKNKDCYYSLYDINKDDTYELIIYNLNPPMPGFEEVDNYDCYVYTYSDGKASEIGMLNTTDNLYGIDGNGILTYFTNFSCDELSISNLENNSLTESEFYSGVYRYGNETTYKYKKESVSENEYNKINNKTRRLSKLNTNLGLDILKNSEKKLHLKMPPLIRKLSERWLRYEIYWNLMLK